MTVEQILLAAKGLIAKPENWTTGRFAANVADYTVLETDPSACKFCARGAINHVVGGWDSNEGVIAADALYRAANTIAPEPPEDGHPIFYINDQLGHEAVMKMFDAAIAKVTGSQCEVRS